MKKSMSPNELHAALAEGYNARDVDALSALFEEDAALVAQPGAPARGAAEIRQAITGFIGIGGVMTVETVEVVPMADLAFTRTSWAIRDGDETKVQANGIEVVRRSADGSWRFLLDHPFGGDSVV